VDLDVAAFERLVARGISVADQNPVDVCARSGLGFVAHVNLEEERASAVYAPWPKMF
jgi:hypothetical protein